MFDPDAPTGSGFSHWRAWDIPATASTFGGQATPPAGTVVGLNDCGDASYDGPCPPAGDVAHHYKIRVLALDTAEHRAAERRDQHRAVRVRAGPAHHRRGAR